MAGVVYYYLIVLMVAASLRHVSGKERLPIPNAKVQHLASLRRKNVNRLIFIKTHKTAGQSVKIQEMKKQTNEQTKTKNKKINKTK